MNPMIKRFIALFLVFSLVVLSGNLYAKRRGTELTIIKKDGHLITGELIIVKENSLLILILSATDVSIDIGDIKIIKIEKKSKVIKGTIFGGLVGVGFSIWEGTRVASETEDSAWAAWAIILGLFIVPASAGIGALIGLVATGADETIQIEGKSDSEIQKTLDKLRKNARVRDYK